MATLTLTLELPEDLATYLSSLPPEERNTLASRVLRDAIAIGNSDGSRFVQMSDPEMAEEADFLWKNLPPERRQEEVAEIQKGLADIDAGRTRPANEVYSRLREKYRVNTGSGE